MIALTHCYFPRIKEKLRNGELTVTGDQWPIFVYHGYSYDPDDPWNGLFRSSLLVTVGPIKLMREIADIHVRRINMSLRRRVRLIRKLKLPVLVTLASMG
jgi:hypothetical protein